MPAPRLRRLGSRWMLLAAGVIAAAAVLTATGSVAAGGPTDPAPDVPNPTNPNLPPPGGADESREPFTRPFYQECALDVTPLGPGQACTTRDLACTWTLLGYRGRCSLQTPSNDATCRMMNRAFPEVCPPPTGKPKPQGGDCGPRTPANEGCPPCPPGGCTTGGGAAGGNLRLRPHGGTAGVHATTAGAASRPYRFRYRYPGSLRYGGR